MNNRERQLQLIQAMAEIAEELGWLVAIPSTDDSDGKVSGLILGTEEFIAEVVNSYDPEAEVLSMDNEGDAVVDLIENEEDLEESFQRNLRKSKQNLH